MDSDHSVEKILLESWCFVSPWLWVLSEIEIVTVKEREAGLSTEKRESESEDGREKPWGREVEGERRWGGEVRTEEVRREVEGERRWGREVRTEEVRRLRRCGERENESRGWETVLEFWDFLDFALKKTKD